MGRVRNITGLWLLAVITPLSAQVPVKGYQTLESISESVRLFVEANVDNSAGETVVSVGELDRRLRLSQCDVPLQAEFANTTRKLGNVTVAVRCSEGTKPWSLMVQARIQHYLEVVVAARPMARGEQFAQGDLKLERIDVLRLNGGYYAAVGEMEGMALKRPVKAGSVLQSSMLSPVVVVRRGERVTIRAHSHSVEVRMQGEAMQAGAVGEVIQVKNISSKQIVDAEVSAPGVVSVRI
ncbi:MAG: flagellar basal body P-ring formation chaperone FlgA [Chromatiales bacterium]|nr:flagellar basal body P-ring formation chaperone FlgA [Chromatiales bacterium]